MAFTNTEHTTAQIHQKYHDLHLIKIIVKADVIYGQGKGNVPRCYCFLYITSTVLDPRVY